MNAAPMTLEQIIRAVMDARPATEASLHEYFGWWRAARAVADALADAGAIDRACVYARMDL